MELRHLRYFVAVAEELSFTRAADRLHTAQPSLSQQIRQLEGEIGVRLLERTKRRVQLTSAGRVLLRESRDILSRVEYAARLASKAAGGQAGEISIGTFPGSDVKILPRLRPLLAKRLPDVRLVMHSKYVLNTMSGLHEGTIDVGFLRGPLSDPDLVIEEVLRERIIAVLPAHHRLARAKRIAVDRLADLPCIAISHAAAPALHDAVATLYQRASVTVEPVQSADNVLGHLGMVAAGLGFALLPDYVSSILPERVVIRPLDWAPEPQVTIVMAHRKSDPSSVVRAFRQLVRECFPANN
jgi:LysR family hca operon transcriptional activator